jgi:hypothetical protein
VKRIFVATVFLLTAITACVLDDPDIADEEGPVTSPAASHADEEGPVTNVGGGGLGCSTPDEAELPRCGGGGGTGGGGGNCIPGDVGCSGPVRCMGVGFRWNNVTRRCEYDRVGEDCSFNPGDRCIRDITGYCQCLFPEGPLLTAPPSKE